MDCKKSINLFEMKKKDSQPIIYDNFFFVNFLIIFRLLIFSDFCYIAKYWNSARAGDGEDRGVFFLELRYPYYWRALTSSKFTSRSYNSAAG